MRSPHHRCSIRRGAEIFMSLPNLISSPSWHIARLGLVFLIVRLGYRTEFCWWNVKASDMGQFQDCSTSFLHLESPGEGATTPVGVEAIRWNKHKSLRACRQQASLIHSLTHIRLERESGLNPS